MIAIVIGRCDTQRAADRLADRFAKAHGRSYLVDKIQRSDFERRPFVVLLHEPDDSHAALASLEVYDVTSRGLRTRRLADQDPEALRGEAAQ